METTYEAIESQPGKGKIIIPQEPVPPTKEVIVDLLDLKLQKAQVERDLTLWLEEIKAKEPRKLQLEAQIAQLETQIAGLEAAGVVVPEVAENGADNQVMP